MELDRVLQRELLQKLASKYPVMEDVQHWGPDPVIVSRTLHYLAEHELVKIVASQEISGGKRVIMAVITARGLDFLADDGGLSAILGVVTVKLHADTIRELIEARIAASDLQQGDKEKLINQVKKLPGKALEELTKRLVGIGLEKIPDVAQLLNKLPEILS